MVRRRRQRADDVAKDGVYEMRVIARTGGREEEIGVETALRNLAHAGVEKRDADADKLGDMRRIQRSADESHCIPAESPQWLRV